jgi:hypothetical protein
MKTINETFTDEEIVEMMSTKTPSGLSWHDLILDAVKRWTPHEDAGWEME